MASRDHLSLHSWPAHCSWWTSKDNRTICQKYGRAPSGEDPFSEVSLDRGVRYSILPALTIDGYLAVRVVEGSINGAEFYDFVVNDVVSLLLIAFVNAILLQLPCMEPFPGPRSVMLIDNCSTHKSNAVRDAVEASGMLCTSCLLRLLLT